MRPPVVCTAVTPTLRVPDVPAAQAEYAKLGFAPGFLFGTPTSFGSVAFAGTEVFLDKGEPAPTMLFFVVDDADAAQAFHRAQGARIEQPIADREYGVRDYAVRDPYGNLLVFGHSMVADSVQKEAERGDPVPVERVEVPLRLERRLAGLLADLAAHRGMTVSSCLEEILLHTNDGVTPHTARTLRHIRDLKARHRIDYDTHASYRFVER